MQPTLTPLARSTRLLPGESMTRRDRNRAYLMRLRTENLLLSHYLEAGLIEMAYKPENIHWGWDSPTSEIRGTVAGHWLSAAARIFAETNDQIAFMDGPVVLAGLVGEERPLYGNVNEPSTMLVPDDERQWTTWKSGWRTAGQPVGWRFKPLYEIGNEVYTVYFPVRRP